MDLSVFGTAGVLAALYTARNWLNTVWQHVSSVLIVRAIIQDSMLQWSLENFCLSEMKASPLGPRTYSATFSQTYSQDVVAKLIPLEQLGSETRMFWWGWVPIWVSGVGTQSNQVNVASTGGGSGSNMHLTYLRGTTSAATLLLAATQHRLQAVAQGVSRHRVLRLAGAGSTPAFPDFAHAGSAGNNGNTASWAQTGARGKPLDDMPLELLETKYAGQLSDMWLCPAAEHFLQDLDYWFNAAAWYQAAGITWRRGYLFWGAPGTGKTSLAKYAAQKYDLPLYVIELATMTDRELYNAMERVAVDAPCMVLFEDHDCVFHKREPAHSKVACTFQAWLNSVDGVKSVPGIVTVVTTNSPEHLDTAAATWQEDTQTVFCSRPGRIDLAVQMQPLTAAGRLQLARRYLGTQLSEPELAAFVAGYADSSAAVFQNDCINKAILLRFQEAHATTTESRIPADIITAAYCDFTRPQADGRAERGTSGESDGVDVTAAV